jgi:divalent metal cation (Fe/Co/Zn/Cd) transporter
VASSLLQTRIPQPTGERHDLLRWGVLLALFTVLWNLAEGAIAVAAGAAAGSVALVGFGVDSFIETASGAFVGWRLWREWKGRSGKDIERMERSSSRVAGALLLALAIYILVDSGGRLLGWGEQPDETWLGVGLTAVSLAIMPFLGRAKLRTARKLGSGALRADAFETIACAWLSLTTLCGLMANALFGWWWADPLAGLVLTPLIAREGLEAWRGEHCHKCRVE